MFCIFDYVYKNKEVIFKKSSSGRVALHKLDQFVSKPYRIAFEPIFNMCFKSCRSIKHLVSSSTLIKGYIGLFTTTVYGSIKNHS